MHRAGDIGDGDVEGDETDGYGEPDEEGNDPAEIVAVKNKTSDPPATAAERQLESWVNEYWTSSIEQTGFGIEKSLTQ